MKLKKLLTEAFEGISGRIITPQVFGKGEGFRTSPKQKINETLPAAAREWKNLEKAEAVLDKAVSSLEKAVSKKDRKSAKEISGLWKYTSNNIKKFKELLGKEVLSKLQ